MSELIDYFRGQPLTAREIQIVLYVAQGMTAQQIAGRIKRQVGTVNWHKRVALAKTGSINITSLIYRLAKEGVI